MLLSRLRIIAPAVVLVIPIVATGAVSSAADLHSVSTHVDASSAQSELPAIKSLKWTSNVKVTYGKGSWTFASSGVPKSVFTASHYAVPKDAFNVSATGASVIATSAVLKNQNYKFTIPETPVYSSTTTTNMGAIGVLLNGGVLYNPYEANKSTVATNDNFSVTVKGVTASFIDTCDGHPGPGGQYHYHGMPACLVAYATTGAAAQVTSVSDFSSATTPAVATTNTAAKKPVLLGFAFDGYGIYDNIDESAATIPVAALDACNGIFSPVPGYAKGVYHYVLENVKSARSSLACYHGVVSSAYTHALQLSINAIAPGATSSSVATPAATAATATARSLAANKEQLEILSHEFATVSQRHVC